MRLNHLDLQVCDVKQSASFFVNCFGFTLVSNPTSSAIAILEDVSGFVLVLQRSKSTGLAYPDGFHLGFYVDSVDIVISTRERALAHGIQVSDLITNNRGTMIYCRAPDGYVVEVNCRPA